MTVGPDRDSWRPQYHYKTMWRSRLAGGLAVQLLFVSVLLVPMLWERGSSGRGGALLLVMLTLVVCGVAVRLGGDAGLVFEYQTRYRFRQVCQAKGLAKKNDKGEWIYPRLSRLAGGDGVVLGTIRPHHGDSVADWERAGPAMALSLQVTGVRYSINGDGTIQMRAGYTPLEADEYRRRERLEGRMPDWAAELEALHVAKTEGGQPYLLPFVGTHILVAGITGAGKGSVLWSLILQLEPAVREGAVKLWAVDPKRLELAQGRSVFGDRYAASEDAILKLLERAVSEMETLADTLAGNARKAIPSPRMPVNVVFIDELGVLSSLITDRKVSQRIDAAIKRLLYLGRALNFIVVGAIQDPRKDNVDYRDGFPTKIAMKLPKPMVDLVLGNGMHEAGAQCDLIPRGKAGAGVAFVTEEGSGLPVCVRFPWCSDELIKTMAGELAPVVEQFRLQS